MSELNKIQLQSENNNSFPNNNAGAITPAILRNFNTDMIDSLVDEITYGVDSASFDSRIDSLEAFSSSLDTNFASQAEFNSYTQSTNTSISSLQSFSSSQYKTDSASFSSRIIAATNEGQFLLTSSFNAYTQSNDSKWNNLGNQSGSWVSSTITGSSLTTASFNNGTRNLTFTKGDNTTFSVNIPDVSGSSGNFVTTSSFNAYTQSNDSKVDSLISATGSYTLTSSFNTYTSSTNSRLNSIEAKTGSYAVTGSNRFNGNQTITGSLTISSSLSNNIIMNGKLAMSGGNYNTNSFPRITMTGRDTTGADVEQTIVDPFQFKITRSGSAFGDFQTTINANAYALYDNNLGYTLLFSSNQIELQGNYGTFGITQDGLQTFGGEQSPAVYNYDNNGNPYSIFYLQDPNNYTDGRIKFVTPVSITNGLNITSGSNQTTGIVQLNGANPGTVTVSNSLVTANSMIFLTKQTNNHPNGPVGISAKSSGSFTILSDNNGDNDLVAYMIINPA